MNKIFFTFIITLIISQYIYSQNNVKHDSTMILCSVGYGISSFGQVNDYYNNIITQYKEEGIPIKKQYGFSRTAYLNLQLLYSPVLPPMWFGVSIGYSFSPAYANYKDFAGILRVNGKITCLDLSITARMKMAEIKDFPIYFSIRPGISHYILDITNSAEFIKYPQSNFSDKAKLTLWAPFIGVTFGTTIHFSHFILELDIGYQTMVIGNHDITLQSSSGTITEIPLGNCYQYGLLTFISIGYTL